jgi:hypothetical protein
MDDRHFSSITKLEKKKLRMGLKFNAISWWILTYKFSYMRGEIKDPIEKMYLQLSSIDLMMILVRFRDLI